ncbi:MAG: cardiolipin synthase [Pseudomonadales bacterium]|nr:cardiolipin synthase [Pseudomonadales bacterium]MDG1441532.1 cardiolipin synthase [Pseudomonadales bacterium]
MIDTEGYIYFFATVYVLGVISAFHAIFTARTPQGASAWSVSLIAMPYLSVPLYLVFGRSRFQGYVHARKNQISVVTDALQDARNKIVADSDNTWLTKEAIRGIERLSRLPLAGGNQVKLLVDGETTYKSMIDGIEAAESYVLIQFYIFRADQSGRRFADALKAKAQEGVTVRFLYDEVGCYQLPNEFVVSLAQSGIEVYPFNTRKGSRNRTQMNFRNHRKVIVVDGKKSWVGGLNIGDEHLGFNAEFGPWRDTHLCIDGPATLGVQVSFVEDWHWSADEIIQGLNWEVPMSRGDSGVVVVPSGPADSFETAKLMYLQLINGAQKRLWIASPYFVPDEGIVSALQLAALRGVDVRILVPNKPDHMMVGYATFAYFDEVHKAGIRMYRYTEGFLHQKVTLVDNKLALVGTANFDNRSFRLNFEISAICLGDEIVRQVEEMLEKDFAVSYEMGAAAFSHRGWFFRLAAYVSRLAAPIL